MSNRAYTARTLQQPPVQLFDDNIIKHGTIFHETFKTLLAMGILSHYAVRFIDQQGQRMHIGFKGVPRGTAD